MDSLRYCKLAPGLSDVALVGFRVWDFGFTAKEPSSRKSLLSGSIVLGAGWQEFAEMLFQHEGS